MTDNSPDEIFTSIKLPCGRTLANRLAKVAMYEHLADFLGGPPNEHHYSLYSKWAVGWGMIITGNVQVSNTHLTLGRDMVIPKDLCDEYLRPFTSLSASIRGSKGVETLVIMQLSHAGRQSTNFIGGRFPFHPPLAPSSIRVTAQESGRVAKALHTLAFQQPTTMSLKDIDDVVEAFVKGARVASLSGFDGIQLHAAHGYLLAQFVSCKSNRRNDDFSADPVNALRLMHQIVSRIRSSTPKGFVIGIKLNAADYIVGDGGAYERVLGHFKAIAQWGQVDFIEVSGGDYERPDFMTQTTSSRQALFAAFSKDAMASLESLSLGPLAPLVLLTGGLRSPELLHTALRSKHAHILGIGRGSVLCPDLPRLLKHAGYRDPSNSLWSMPFRPEPTLDSWGWFRTYLPKIPLLGAGINMAWYIVTMRRLTTQHPFNNEGVPSPEPDYSLGPVGAIVWMWMWTDKIDTIRQWMISLSLVVSLCAIATYWLSS